MGITHFSGERRHLEPELVFSNKFARAYAAQEHLFCSSVTTALVLGKSSSLRAERNVQFAEVKTSLSAQQAHIFYRRAMKGNLTRQELFRHLQSCSEQKSPTSKYARSSMLAGHLWPSGPSLS